MTRQVMPGQQRDDRLNGIYCRMAVQSVLAIALLTVFALSAGAVSSDDHDYPLASARTPLGLVWTDDDGMTLYTHTRDRPSTSSCVADCAEMWPPLLAEPRHRQFPPQGFSVITRPDGDLQWAYRNRPLYRYSGDEAPGELTGHGRNDRWWIATPE